MTEETRAQLAAAVGGKARDSEAMALHTALKVGGPADLFVVPADLNELQALLQIAREAGIPCLVIGGGFNLLVRDGGIRGVVISLSAFNGIGLDGGCNIRVEAGVTNPRLAAFAKDAALSGLEFLGGIPGTIGGAISVNAGAHGQAVLGLVKSLATVLNGTLTVRGRQELEYGYRYLKLEPGEIVISAEMGLEAGDTGEIEARMKDYQAHRIGSQKVGFPNAGSFFKNPDGDQAWRLIAAAGLRGYQIGGAQVSEIHSNFLVNRGGATAGDFLRLASVIKERVREKTGVVLQEEVRIVGED